MFHPIHVLFSFSIPHNFSSWTEPVTISKMEKFQSERTRSSDHREVGLSSLSHSRSFVSICVSVETNTIYRTTQAWFNSQACFALSNSEVLVLKNRHSYSNLKPEFDNFLICLRQRIQWTVTECFRKERSSAILSIESNTFSSTQKRLK